MTTATVPIAVTCPDWCTVAAEHHAANLWEYEGNCIHRAPIEEVADVPTGPRRAMEEVPEPYPTVEVTFTSMTDMAGRETEAPVFFIDTREFSIEQVLALAAAINRAVESYRSTGGKA